MPHAPRTTSDSSSSASSSSPAASERHTQRVLPPRASQGAVAPCLKLGASHKEYRFGAYTLCLTDNQWWKLFHRRTPQVLGCGTFACAFFDPENPARVVKLTRDVTDVSAMVAAQRFVPERVPHVYGAWTLPQGGHNQRGKPTPVYATIVERLAPFPLPERKWRDRVMEAVYKVSRRNLPAARAWLRTAKIGCPTGEPRCLTFARELLGTTQQLAENGIDWFDVHAGNVGVDSEGRWKIMDLGLTGHRADAPREVLQGRLAGAMSFVRKKLPYGRRPTRQR